MDWIEELKERNEYSADSAPWWPGDREDPEWYVYFKRPYGPIIKVTQEYQDGSDNERQLAHTEYFVPHAKDELHAYQMITKILQEKKEQYG